MSLETVRSALPRILLFVALGVASSSGSAAGDPVRETQDKGASFADAPIALTPRGPTLVLLGARHVPGRREGPRDEFADALGPGVDLVRERRGASDATGSLGTFEDWVRLPTPPREPRVRYELSLGALAGLRLVAGVLEVLDAEGAPRAHMLPPWIANARGQRRPVGVEVRGCAVDRDPRAPWGRAPVAPGAATCTVELSWDLAASDYPALLDPEWTDAGDLAVERSLHSATLLPSGRVLIAGGYSTSLGADLATSELYDPTTRTFAATGSLTTARRAHTATALDGGLVLVLGGDVSFNPPRVLASVERYEPSTGEWASLPSLSEPRSHHTASRLRDGRVLVVGSLDYSRDGVASSVVELCASDGASCRRAASLAVPRASHTASLLPDGRLLVAGGGARIFNDIKTLHASTELFDPLRDAWSAGPTLPRARFDHAAVTLASGTTLLIGGSLAPQGEVTTGEVLAVSPAGAVSVTRPLAGTRWLHQATEVSGERVLVLGNAAAFYSPSATAAAELYEPAASTTTADLEPRYWHTQTLLGDGSVLVVGGSARAPRRARVFTPPAPPTPPPTTTAPPPPSTTASAPSPPPSPTSSGVGSAAPSEPTPTTGFYACAVMGDPAPPAGGVAAALVALVLAAARRRRTRGRA
ncbi:MAG: hypothetical protein IPF92_10170 [Myxococcales bacterium]|nr:hypothetical protein [Myxococcales bacterium]MBL0192890.1 hypothetical protein [Myxococcales bacterium]HQY63098.1 kelch repeat-containing protein [Polyangiaceae bacterium]